MAKKRVSDRQFAESKHQYTDPRTGERLTSVTTICEMLDIGSKLRAGAGAAMKLNREGKNYQKEWKEKADLGSRVHGYCALWVEGRTADIPNSDGPYMDAFAAFCDDYKPTWLEAERPVVSSLGYGGRFDGVAELGDGFTDPLYTLIDVKTGRHWVHPLTLQLVGYRRADGMVVYDEEGWAKRLDPMPHIDACAGLYLHEDGTYDLIYVNADDAAFDAFTKLLAIKKWASTIKQPKE